MSSDLAASHSSPRPDTPDDAPADAQLDHAPDDAPSHAPTDDTPDSDSLKLPSTGLTFARTRTRPRAHDPGSDNGQDNDPDHDHDHDHDINLHGEPLLPRPIPGRPASFGSTSTPDDTPSVQVRSQQPPTPVPSRPVPSHATAC